MLEVSLDSTLDDLIGKKSSFYPSYKGSPAVWDLDFHENELVSTFLACECARFGERGVSDLPRVRASCIGARSCALGANSGVLRCLLCRTLDTSHSWNNMHLYRRESCSEVAKSAENLRAPSSIRWRPLPDRGALQWIVYDVSVPRNRPGRDTREILGRICEAAGATREMMSPSCPNVQRAQAGWVARREGPRSASAGSGPPVLQAHARMIVLCTFRNESTEAALQGGARSDRTQPAEASGSRHETPIPGVRS
jgi:hypothetical protein